jgi:hypothetical protein
MKAVVVEFTPAWSGWASPEKAVAERPNGKTDWDIPRANLPQLSDDDHGTAPLWTWFIENPRESSVA